jgi:PAS domain S-box-containing protein
MAESKHSDRMPPSLPYQEIVEQAGDAIFVADANGRYTAANRRALELLGYSEEELLAKRIFDLHPPEDLQAAPLNLARLDGGNSVITERRLVRKDGTIIEAELSARRLSDGSMFSIVRDITERKRASAALRESEERYRQLFDQNMVVKLIIDPETAGIVDANQAAVNYYGYPRERLLKMQIFDLNTAPHAWVRNKIAEAHAASQSNFLVEHRLADGRVRQLEVYSGPITLKGKRFLHVLLLDVTERREAEARLRRSEVYHRTILENVSDLIMIVAADFVTSFATSSSRRLLGFEPDFIVGKPATEFIHPDDLLEIAEKWARLLTAPGSSETSEIRVRRSDGSWCNMVSTATNLLHDVNVGGILVNSRDITARVAAEAELRERTDELERLNQFMVDRELRMVELKREVAVLKKALGERGQEPGA